MLVGEIPGAVHSYSARDMLRLMTGLGEDTHRRSGYLRARGNGIVAEPPFIVFYISMFRSARCRGTVLPEQSHLLVGHVVVSQQTEPNNGSIHISANRTACADGHSTHCFYV